MGPVQAERGIDFQSSTATACLAAPGQPSSLPADLPTLPFPVNQKSDVVSVFGVAGARVRRRHRPSRAVIQAPSCSQSSFARARSAFAAPERQLTCEWCRSDPSGERRRRRHPHLQATTATATPTRQGWSSGRLAARPSAPSIDSFISSTSSLLLHRSAHAIPPTRVGGDGEPRSSVRVDPYVRLARSWVRSSDRDVCGVVLLTMSRVENDVSSQNREPTHRNTCARQLARRPFGSPSIAPPNPLIRNRRIVRSCPGLAVSVASLCVRKLEVKRFR